MSDRPGSQPHNLDASGLRVAVVAARFNEQVSRQLVDGALGELRRLGVTDDAITTVWVAGAFELPVVLEHLAARGETDAMVAIGCIVRGGTPHFEYVADACTSGVAAVARTHAIPIGFGVLTTDDDEQAFARAGGALGNRGADAAFAAVETALVLRQL